MKNNIDRIAEELFDKIRSRFDDISLGDENVEEPKDDNPSLARFFNFDYKSADGVNYGNITMSILDEESLKIWYSSNLTDKIQEQEADVKEWFNFLKSLRYFAKRNMMKFDVRDISADNLTIRDLKSIANTMSSYDTKDKATQSVNESQFYNNSRTSIQEFGPVKLVIRHSDPVNEEIPGSRSRKIHNMFIETELGERFLLPFKRVNAGRAMAEHLAHGGLIHDDVSKHIVGIVNEMGNLAFFVRGTKNRVFEDNETQAMVEAAISRYHNLRSDLKKLGGSRGYENFAETFQPSVPIEEQYDIEELKNRFVKKMFDDRLTNALPYVHRAYTQHKMTEENKYIKEFDDWADEVTGDEDIDISGIGKLMQKPIEVGLDGLDAINAIKPFIPDNNEDLFSKIKKLGDDIGTSVDARPVLHDWLQDNGYPSSFKSETDPEQEPTPELPPPPSPAPEPEPTPTVPPTAPPPPKAPPQPGVLPQPMPLPGKPLAELAALKRLAGL